MFIDYKKRKKETTGPAKPIGRRHHAGAFAPPQQPAAEGDRAAAKGAGAGGAVLELGAALGQGGTA